jgi:hypothetical protein
MVILAEIADKMLTVPQIWIKEVLISVILATPALFYRRIAIYTFAVGVVLMGVFACFRYYEAYLEPVFSVDVQREMGTVWIANSIISSICPALFTGVILLRQIKENKTRRKQ